MGLCVDATNRELFAQLCSADAGNNAFTDIPLFYIGSITVPLLFALQLIFWLGTIMYSYGVVKRQPSRKFQWWILTLFVGATFMFLFVTQVIFTFVVNFPIRPGWFITILTQVIFWLLAWLYSPPSSLFAKQLSHLTHGPSSQPMELGGRAQESGSFPSEYEAEQ